MKNDTVKIVVIVVAIVSIVIIGIIGLLIFLAKKTYDAVDEGSEYAISKAQQAWTENDKLEATEGAKLEYMQIKTIIMQNSNDDPDYNAKKDINNLIRVIKSDLLNESRNLSNGWKSVKIEDDDKIAMIYTSNNFDTDLKYTIVLTEKSANMNEEPVEIDKEDYENETTSEQNYSIDYNQETMENKAFNSKFEVYILDSASGSQVNELIESIKESNESNKDREIRIKAKVSNWDYETNRANTQSYYKVTCEYDDNGYIKTIFLEDAE